MKSRQGQFRFLTFFLIGAIAFLINTNLEINPYVQLYLALFQVQGATILGLYILAKHRKSKNSNLR
jgi:hypothetical protein